MSFEIAFITISRVMTATMLFLQFVLCLSSFAGTLKSEIPGAALKLCQVMPGYVSPDILKFSTKHKDNYFTLNYFLVPFCLYFMEASVDWILIIFGNQVIQKKRPGRPVFPDYLSVSYDYAISICINLIRY